MLEQQVLVAFVTLVIAVDDSAIDQIGRSEQSEAMQGYLPVWRFDPDPNSA